MAGTRNTSSLELFYFSVWDFPVCQQYKFNEQYKFKPPNHKWIRLKILRRDDIVVLLLVFFIQCCSPDKFPITCPLLAVRFVFLHIISLVSQPLQKGPDFIFASQALFPCFAWKQSLPLHFFSNFKPQSFRFQVLACVP